MTNRDKKVKKIINNKFCSIFLSCIIVIFALIGTFAFFDTFLMIGWGKYGPYHKPCIVEQPSYLTFFNEKQYCVAGYRLCEITNGLFKEISIKENNKQASIYCLQPYDDYLCVSSLSSVFVLDSSLSIIDIIHQEGFMNFVVYNDIIIDVTDYPSCNNFRILDLKTGELTINSEKHVINSYCQFQGATFYIGSRGEISYLDPDVVYGYRNYNFATSLFYPSSDGLLNFVIDGNNVILNENKASILIPFDNPRFYSNLYREEDVLLFAIKNDAHNEKCIAHIGGYNCICSFAETVVFGYNLTNNSFAQYYSLNEGDVAVLFDLHNIYYYHSSGFYKNFNLVINTTNLQIGQNFYETENDYFNIKNAYCWYFLHCDKTYFYIKDFKKY